MKNGRVKKVAGRLQASLLQILRWFLRSVVLPTLSTLLAFFIFVWVYGALTGVNVTRFSPQQISSTITNAVRPGTEYRLEKVDFYGFGYESYVAFADESENGANSKLKIVVFDEVQTNPLERFLFTDRFYKTSFSFSPSSIEDFNHFSEITKVSYHNQKKRLFFCILEGCAFLQNNGKDYEIIPAIDDRDAYCSKQIQIDSNLGAKKLSRIPFDTRIFFRAEGEQLYIASAVDSLKDKVAWDDPGHDYDFLGNDTNEEKRSLYAKEGKSKYQICKYIAYDQYGPMTITGDHGSDFCYRTTNSFFTHLYEDPMDEIDDIIARSYNNLENEINSNIKRNWPEGPGVAEGLCPTL